MSDNEDARGEAENGGMATDRGEEERPREGKNHKKYRKDKPWDDPSVDHWAIPDWKEENMKVTL